jgi:hypothetical protein
MKTLLLTLALVGCASQYEAKKISTKMEIKDSIDGKKLGLNSDNEVIIQEEVSASDELRSQQWLNAKLEDDLNSVHIDLKQCREDLADQRLGGNGVISDIPEIDNMKQTSEVKEEFGLGEDGKLKLVKKEFYLDVLNREKKYTETLKSTTKLVSKHNDSCQRMMGQKRLKAGLPSKRYQAQGYFMEDGTWVSTAVVENNINDAFERSARNGNDK